ncbi:MAG: DUF2079 domain-containing protein [Cellulomonadaceae bacterium]
MSDSPAPHDATPSAQVTPAAPSTPSGAAPTAPWWPVAAITLVCLGLYLALTLARWHRWENPSWDLAIFEQAVRGWANLGWPIVDIKGPGFNQLGDHFSPLLMVLAPFYRVFPSALTLLVAQCVLIAVSIVPLTRTAQRLVTPRAGLAIGLAYGLSWGVQSALDVQFHEYALAVPLLAFGLAAALEKRWTASCVWIALLLGVKEDLGLTVAGFGVVLWLWGQRRRGVWMAGIGAAGMALVLLVIIPILNPQGRYDYWGKLAESTDPTGADTGGAGAGDLLAGAWHTVAGIFTPAVKYETVLLLLVVTAFVALRSPILLMAVPTLLWRFAGSNEYYWGSTWHYSVILMPIVFAAGIDGLRLLRASPRRWARGYARAAPALMVLVSLVSCLRFPFGDLVRPETYAQPDRVATARQVLDQVPPGSSVVTDIGLIVQLTEDRTVYWVGTVGDAQPDYAVIDRRTGWGANAPQNVAEYAAKLTGGRFEVVFDSDDYVVARRVD